MNLDRTREPAPGPIRTFAFPPIHRSRLANGLTVLTAPQPRLPLVTVRVVLDAGAAGERAGEEGLATLVANALEGGTARLDGEALAWELESLGLQLEAWATWDALHVSCTAVRAQLPAALALVAEIVRQPAFPDAEVARMRAEQLAELLQRQVDPRALADDMATHFFFADDARYAVPLIGRRAAIEGFTPAAAAAFHRARFVPAACAVILTGDVEPAAARALVERTFGDWTGEAAPAAQPFVAPRAESARVYLVDKPGAVQSELRLGHVGLPRAHPDFFGLVVMNAILGGTFTSRLNLSLREKHGFTYGVRSSFGFRRHAGPFVIQTAVGTDVTLRALEEARREVARLLEEGANEEEVASARDYLAGVFPLELQTTEQLAAKLAELFVYDLPDDYFEHYRGRIGAVTREEVTRVARAHVRPERMAYVVVGDGSTLSAGLEQLGIAPLSRHAPSAALEVGND